MKSEYRTPFRNIKISSIPSGRILDIGGGGEGIIARIGKENVTAIDKLKEEIEEARDKSPEAVWQVADAKDLPFGDGSFPFCTAFFSLMYMRDSSIKNEVFREVYRVLEKDGELWIWDTEVDVEEDLFVIMMNVELPDSTIIKTGYGVRTDFRQSLKQTGDLLTTAGFTITTEIIHEGWYFLKVKK